MVRLGIAALKSGHRTDVLSPTASDLGIDAVAIRDVSVTADLDRREGPRLVVRLAVGGTARLVCDRTLVEFDQALAATGNLLFVSEDEIEALGGESDEVRVLPHDASEVDVTDAVRDLLLLSIPLRRIAPGAEDVEIETRFGAPDESDTDPRWEALRRLRAGDASGG